MGAALLLCKLEPGKIEIFPKPGNTETFPFQSLSCIFSYCKTESHVPAGYKTSAFGCISTAAAGGFRCCPPARLPSSLGLGVEALLQPRARGKGNPLPGGWFTPCSLR